MNARHTTQPVTASIARRALVCQRAGGKLVEFARAMNVSHTALSKAVARERRRTTCR